jgi:hypothetical protein
VFLDISGIETVSPYFYRKDICFTVLKEIQEKHETEIRNTLSRPVLIPALANILNGGRTFERRHILRDADKPSSSFWTKDVLALVIDDNMVNILVAKGLLEKYGARVDTASGGAEGIAKIKEKITTLCLWIT